MIEQMSKTKYATLSASTVLFIQGVQKRLGFNATITYSKSQFFLGHLVLSMMSIHVLAFEILSITVEITQ